MPAEDTCANCDRSIGHLEEASVWKDNVVCSECYERLSTAGIPKEVHSAHDERKEITVKIGGESKAGVFTSAGTAVGLIIGVIVGLLVTADSDMPGLGALFGGLGGMLVGFFLGYAFDSASK